MLTGLAAGAVVLMLLGAGMLVLAALVDAFMGDD